MPDAIHANTLIAMTMLLLAVSQSTVAGRSQIRGHTMQTTNNRVLALTRHTQTICLGRFLIDVPQGAEIIYGPARLPVHLSRFEGAGSDFEEYVARALARVEENREFAYGPLKGEQSMLGTVIDGIGPHHKIILDVGKATGTFYNVRSFVSVGNDLYLQEYSISGEGDEYLEAVSELKTVASLLRSRSDDEIPSIPGICLNGGFLSEPRHYMLEAVSLGIRLKEFSDVHISIQMTKKEMFIESDALEPRMKRAEEAAKVTGMGQWYSRIKILRRGYRRWGGWEGFEVLVRKPAQQYEGENHEFAYQSHGEPRNPLLPVLEIELHSGVSENRTGGTKPSITDQEAVHLWDAIIGSIRPRPTTAPPQSAGVSGH